MISIQEILEQRLNSAQSRESLEKQLKEDAGKYHQNWLFAVQCFQKRVNKDCFREGKRQYPFMAIHQKLQHIKGIDDLRWFYQECLKYSYHRDKKTGKLNKFSKCFFGALKVDNKNRKY